MTDERQKLTYRDFHDRVYDMAKKLVEETKQQNLEWENLLDRVPDVLDGTPWFVYTYLAQEIVDVMEQSEKEIAFAALADTCALQDLSGYDAFVIRFAYTHTEQLLTSFSNDLWGDAD